MQQKVIQGRVTHVIEVRVPGEDVEEVPDLHGRPVEARHGRRGHLLPRPARRRQVGVRRVQGSHLRHLIDLRSREKGCRSEMPGRGSNRVDASRRIERSVTLREEAGTRREEEAQRKLKTRASGTARRSGRGLGMAGWSGGKGRRRMRGAGRGGILLCFSWSGMVGARPPRFGPSGSLAVRPPVSEAHGPAWQFGSVWNHVRRLGSDGSRRGNQGRMFGRARRLPRTHHVDRRRCGRRHAGLGNVRRHSRRLASA
jgi:hypothetical protein